MNTTVLRILIFAMLVGFCPVPVSDFLLGIGFAPVSFVLFQIGSGFVSYASPLYLIYLAEVVLYMAVFWFIAGRVTRIPPLPRRLLGTALLAASILLWFAPIHIPIEHGIGEQKPLAALFAEEYNRFQFERSLQKPPEPIIHRTQEGIVHIQKVTPQIESMQTARPELVQQSAAGKKVHRTDE